MRARVTLLTAFRRVFALKLALIAYPVTSVPVAIAAVAGFLLAWGKAPRAGMLLLLVPLATTIVPVWPYTINHRAFEGIVLLILALASPDEESFSIDVIRWLILSVWFYAGVQKLVHGYYLNGEWFALHAMTYGTDRGGIIDFLVRHSGTLAAFAPCCTTTDVALSASQKALFIFLGSSVVVAELGLPLLALFRRTRTLGLAGLFGLQLAIAFSSAEVDFALSSAACLCLFIPGLAKWAYPVLGALTVAVWGLA